MAQHASQGARAGMPSHTWWSASTEMVSRRCPITTAVDSPNAIPRPSRSEFCARHGAHQIETRTGQRQSEDGRPAISTDTNWCVLHDAGFGWSTDQSWCEPATVVRKRKSAARRISCRPERNPSSTTVGLHFLNLYPQNIAHLGGIPIVLPRGSMQGMTKEKVTITLDRSKAENARSLVGARSTSEVVDMALDHLIRAARLRRDIAAYQRVPPTVAETEIAALAGSAPLDKTDWEALYTEET